MGKTRALGAVLCVVGAIVFALYVGFVLAKLGWLSFDFFEYATTTSWFIVIPVAVGVWVVSALGVWLGWIMATTKEVAPVTESPKEEKKKKK